MLSSNVLWIWSTRWPVGYSVLERSMYCFVLMSLKYMYASNYFSRKRFGTVIAKNKMVYFFEQQCTTVRVTKALMSEGLCCSVILTISAMLPVHLLSVDICTDATVLIVCTVVCRILRNILNTELISFCYYSPSILIVSLVCQYCCFVAIGLCPFATHDLRST